MITSFNTAGAAASSTPTATGKSNNTFLYIIGAAVLAFVGYEFVYKPMQLKKKQASEKK